MTADFKPSNDLIEFELSTLALLVLLLCAVLPWRAFLKAEKTRSVYENEAQEREFQIYTSDTFSEFFAVS